MSEMHKKMAKMLVTYAASRAITCPECGEIMDQSRTVVAGEKSSGREIVLCAPCWGRSPMLIFEGPVTVYDGRLLFAKPRQVKPRKSRKAKPAQAPA
jgi:hypothetical protein